MQAVAIAEQARLPMSAAAERNSSEGQGVYRTLAPMLALTLTLISCSNTYRI